jgi:hypothetical protein
MAATEKKQMHWISAPDGVAPEVVVRKMTGSMGIFMPGAPGYVGQSGTVSLADTSDGTGDVIHGFIVGLVDQTITWPLTAALTANDEILFQLIDTDDLYAVYVENAASDAAAPVTLIGDQYGLVVSSTAGEIGYTTMNTANSNVAVQVVDVMANRNAIKYDTTTTPGVAIVKFLSAVVNGTRAS